MFDLFLKIIDKSVEFLKRKEEVNTKKYEKLIAPIMNDFETAHNHFIKCFLEYKKLLKDTQNDFNLEHPVFDKMKEDMLVSASIRTKVVEFYRLSGGPSFHHYSIWQALAEYFDVSEEIMINLNDADYHYYGKSLNGGFWMQTMAVPPTILSLINIAKNEGSSVSKIDAAMSAINDALEAIQINYSRVAEAHTRIKLELLRSK